MDYNNHSEISFNKMKCSGKGDCLNQIGCNSSKYEKPETPCFHNCEPKQCPNFKVCDNIVPEWCINFKGNNACISCYYMGFKQLTFSGPEECSSCMTTTECVQHPKYTQKLCISCFKHTYCEKIPPHQPEFPYSEEIRVKYEKGDKEIEEDPLVIEWVGNMIRWYIH